MASWQEEPLAVDVGSLSRERKRSRREPRLSPS
jgi:hypothetical protein